MKKQVITLNNKGMTKDISVSKVNNDFAYENFNIRIIPTDKDTLLTVTNEKGNKPIELISSKGTSSILSYGTLIGHSVLDRYLVLFFHNDSTNKDSIIRIEYKKELNKWYKREILVNKNLNFSSSNPLETISNYESEDIMKIYWVDGINQPRFVNISDKYLNEHSNNILIDFVSEFKSNFNVSIEKTFIGESGFKSGIIQYIFTYSNKYGQETNPIHITSIYYLTHPNRGGSEEDKLNCQFNIKLTNLDTNNYDTVNIYSIVRTSLGGEFAAYKVTSLNTANTVTYTDNGNYSESIDVSKLLYIGGREITASTITAKDNTLFLGDLMLKSLGNDNNLKEVLRRQIDNRGYNPYLTFVYQNSANGCPYNLPKGYYDYDFQLNESSTYVTTFKTGQKYRFALRFITKTGSKSPCYWIGDIVNTLYPVIDEDNKVIKKASIQYKFTPEVKKAIPSTYVKAELMVAQISELDRNVVAQGFVVPTMFSLLSRYNNAPFSIPSWFTRMRNSRMINRHYESVPANDSQFAEIQCINNNSVTPYINVEKEENPIVLKAYTFSVKKSQTFRKVQGIIKRYDIRKNSVDAFNNKENLDGTFHYSEIWKTSSSTNYSSLVTAIRHKLGEWGFGPEQIDISSTYNNEAGYRFNNIDAWLDSVKEVKKNFEAGTTHLLIKKSPSLNISVFSDSEAYDYSLKNKNNFFIDESIVSFYSPEINKDTTYKFNDVNYKFRIVGIAPITSNITNYSIVTDNNDISSSVFDVDFNKKNLSSNSEGLSTFPLFSSEQKLWYTYPWQKTNAFTKSAEEYTDTDPKNVLKNKTIANLRFSFKTFYNATPWTPKAGINTLKSYDSDSVSLKQFTYHDDNRMYQGNFDTVLSCERTISSEIPSNEIANHYGEDGGYYINNTGKLNELSSINNIESSMSAEYDGEVKGHNDKLCYDPVKISFKSCPHSIISFKYYKEDQITLPDSRLETDNGVSVGTPSILDVESENDWLPWEKVNKVVSNYPVYSVLTPSLCNTNPNITVFPDYFEGQDSNIANHLYNVTIPKKFVDAFLEFKNPAILYKNNSGETIPYKLNRYIISKKNKLNVIDNVRCYFNRGGAGTATIEFDKSTFTEEVVIKVYNEGNQLLDTYTSKSNSCSIYNLHTNEPYEKLIITATSYPGKYENLFEPSDEVIILKLQKTDHDIDTHIIDYIKDLSQGTEPSDNTTFEATFWLSDITDKTIILVINNKSYEYKDGVIGEPIANEYFSIYKDNPYTTKVNKDSYDFPYIFIGELYNDNIKDQYGGMSDYALQNNTFVPTFGVMDLSTSDIIIGNTGDTFFQRWDCERILPLKEDSENSVIDMVSLYLETYINLDGRYDNRRGLMDNLKSTLENTNLINNVYSASGSNGGNTIFTSKILDDKFNLNKFPSQITWSKAKIPTEEVDTWTNITLASVLDMDGNKGPVRALRRFNNSIISFQDKGISEVLFNSRTQLSTMEGVPIEIANSSKVDGKRYLSDKMGCSNKWSIVETKRGLYFIDNISSSINLFNGQFESLSDKYGFKNWIQQNNSMSSWNPGNPTNFIGYWDKINDDIYFVNPCLQNNTICFNEMINSFTSFYNYGNVPMMINLEDKFVSFRDNKLWLQGEGEYNKIFNEEQPFYTLYRINPNPYTDKIFSNIEYKADMFDSSDNLTDSTFNKLKVWNEYQSNEIEINKDTLDSYPDVKRKFRTWRLDIPRDKINSDNPYGLNRMRNPWLYIELLKNYEGNQRMEFHNIDVTYFE